MGFKAVLERRRRAIIGASWTSPDGMETAREGERRGGCAEVGEFLR
jgi:hypothetical protein